MKFVNSDGVREDSLTDQLIHTKKEHGRKPMLLRLKNLRINPETFFIFSLIILSLVSLFDFERDLCKSCESVQDSVYSNIFNIYLPFLGILSFTILLFFKIFKKSDYLFYFLCVLFGLDLYLQIIQFFVLKATCYICLAIFFILASLLIVEVTRRTYLKLKSFLIILSSFLSLHFYFFPPVSPDIKRTGIVYPGAKKVILYASMECPHCREAMEYFRNLCVRKNCTLIVKPVGDRETCNWICRELFNNSRLGKLFSQEILKINYEEIKNISKGELRLPLIFIENGEDKRKFVGFSEEVKREIELCLTENEEKLSIHFITSPEEQTENFCSENCPEIK